jgi:hypothetical protein
MGMEKGFATGEITDANTNAKWNVENRGGSWKHIQIYIRGLWWEREYIRGNTGGIRGNIRTDRQAWDGKEKQGVRGIIQGVYREMMEKRSGRDDIVSKAGETNGRALGLWKYRVNKKFKIKKKRRPYIWTKRGSFKL